MSVDAAERMCHETPRRERTGRTEATGVLFEPGVSDSLRFIPWHADGSEVAFGCSVATCQRVEISADGEKETCQNQEPGNWKLEQESWQHSQKCRVDLDPVQRRRTRGRPQK